MQLLALLVPTLISYLLDENAISSAPQVSRALHDFALQNLMRIGPLYPAAFKIVIGAAPELKIRLESAIRANQASNRAKAAARLAQPTVQAAPTIKLKTSFFWSPEMNCKQPKLRFSLYVCFVVWQPISTFRHVCIRYSFLRVFIYSTCHCWFWWGRTLLEVKKEIM